MIALWRIVGARTRYEYWYWRREWARLWALGTVDRKGRGW